MFGTPGRQCYCVIMYPPPLDLHVLHTRHGHVRKCTSGKVTKTSSVLRWSQHQLTVSDSDSDSDTAWQ